MEYIIRDNVMRCKPHRTCQLKIQVPYQIFNLLLFSPTPHINPENIPNPVNPDSEDFLVNPDSDNLCIYSVFNGQYLLVFQLILCANQAIPSYSYCIKYQDQQQNIRELQYF